MLSLENTTESGVPNEGLFRYGGERHLDLLVDVVVWDTWKLCYALGISSPRIVTVHISILYSSAISITQLQVPWRRLQQFLGSKNCSDVDGDASIGCFQAFPLHPCQGKAIQWCAEGGASAS